MVHPQKETRGKIRKAVPPARARPPREALGIRTSGQKTVRLTPELRYSTVTATTLGYGDYTPGDGFSRILVVTQLCGSVLFLIFVEGIRRRERAQCGCWSSPHDSPNRQVKDGVSNDGFAEIQNDDQ